MKRENNAGVTWCHVSFKRRWVTGVREQTREASAASKRDGKQQKCVVKLHKGMN